MPSLIDIRRRIRSVKNTQQITKAMKMVSAAKLRRAQDRVIAARPYGAVLERMLQNVAQAAATEDEEKTPSLLKRREEKRVLLLVVTADRGLAGAFNANIIKLAQRFMDEHPATEVTLELMGRRGREHFRRRYSLIAGEHSALFLKTVEYGAAMAIAKTVIDGFCEEKYDAVYVAANYFKSVVASDVVMRKILPMEIRAGGERTEYIFEQPAEQLLASLLPRYVELQVYRAMLESSAAEHAARMTAMDAASTNAAEMIDKLTLNMNRVRQASITREIIEIVSGASALG